MQIIWTIQMNSCFNWPFVVFNPGVNGCEVHCRIKTCVNDNDNDDDYYRNVLIWTDAHNKGKRQRGMNMISQQHIHLPPPCPHHKCTQIFGQLLMPQPHCIHVPALKRLCGFMPSIVSRDHGDHTGCGFSASLLPFK